MPRTDAHSPKNLITENYEYVGCGHNGSPGEPGYSPLAPGQPGAYLIQEGWVFGENESAGDCYHCGAHIKYYAVLKHLPTHTLVKVGETCLANRFELATSEFHRLRKAAELDRASHRIKTAREAWFSGDGDRKLAYDWAKAQLHDEYNEFRAKFIRYIENYGTTSDKFVAAILRDKERTEQRKAQQAAEQAARTDVIEGRIEITGQIVATKWQETPFGNRTVMTVKDDRGFLVWGTLPSSLYGSGKGDRVSFIASIEKSDRDSSFGFFKRPSKAKLLETAAEAA